jgi:hypothetical protein
MPRLSWFLPLLAIALPAAAQQADLPDPALAPPPPVQLGNRPAARAGTPPRLDPVPLIAGVEALPGGGWRLTGPALQLADTRVNGVLGVIGSRLATIPTGRVTILSQVAGPAQDSSIAHRTALANGRSVRRALEAGGLAGTRIDIRPLGRTAEAVDAVTVLPPGVPQPAIAR